MFFRIFSLPALEALLYLDKREFGMMNISLYLILREVLGKVRVICPWLWGNRIAVTEIIGTGNWCMLGWEFVSKSSTPNSNDVGFLVESNRVVVSLCDSPRSIIFVRWRSVSSLRMEIRRTIRGNVPVS